jgi:hypothetical protein
VPGATALGGRAAGPGACAQGSSGGGVPRVGKRARPARLTGGGGRGDEAHAWQPLSGALDPGALATGALCPRGALERGELPRAGQPGPWPGVSAGGVAPRPGWGACARAPPPSPRRLCASDRGSARSPRGRLRRRRAAGWPARASCGGVEPCHPGGCRGCRGRGPPPRALGRERPPPWHLGGHPARRRVGARDAWLTAAGVGDRAWDRARGGSGGWHAPPRGDPERSRPHGRHDV